MKKKPIEQSILDVLPELSAKDIARKFMLFFPLFFFLVFSIITLFIHIEYQKSFDQLAKEQFTRLHLVRYLILQDLKTLASDLSILANSEALQSHLNSASAVVDEDLKNRFLLFVRDRKVYDQARFINLDGDEIIRVNMADTPVLVEVDDLQNKKGRYYFTKTLLQKPGGIFVSPLDLNVENGQIQEPFAPVIRVGTPVFDEQQVKGIVLINFNASYILNHYSQVYGSKDNHTFTMLNKQGYYLKAEDPTMEWGFMLNNDNNTLQHQEPELWQIIQHQKEGQVLLPAGLFTFETISPDQLVRAGGQIVIDQDPLKEEVGQPLAWHLVVHTPRSQLTYLSFLHQHQELFFFIPVIIIVLILVSLHFSISRVRKMHFEGSLNLLSTAVEQSPAAVIITSDEGEIQYANPKFERMSGYSRADVLGENPRIFKSGTTSDNVYDALWKTVLQGREWKGDFENKHKDGSSYYVSAQIAPLVGPKNQIKSLLAIQEDVTEKVALQKQLEEMATLDSLTGVLNRGQFLSLAGKELRRSARYDSTAALIIFDLDHFKKVNDTFGHDVGDLVLITFVDTITAGLRDTDLLGRLGGEEFAALVFESDKSTTFQLAERLRQATENLVVKHDFDEIRVTVSIGYTLLKKDDKKINEAIKRADDALYIAKEKGRNRTEFFD